MSPRPKKRGNLDLPLNLYSKTTRQGVYFQYKHPITGKFTGFGYDKDKAIAAAIQLNSILIPKNTLIDKVVAPVDPLSDFFIHYRDKVMPKKRTNGVPLSESTMTERRRIIKHLIAELGHFCWSSITQEQIAKYLNAQSTAEVYNKHRALLVLIWKKAISDGKTKENLPDMILKSDTEATKRDPLTLEQYRLIYEQARPAIRNAMELALNLMQRRSDIHKMRFDEVRDDHLHIIIQKTRKHGKTSYIRVPCNAPVSFSMTRARTVGDLIKNCRDNHLSPYLVHEPRQRRKESKTKGHWMQLTLKQISNGFAEAREAAGIKSEYPPTFHELIALGEILRLEQGWSKKQIQSLRGHTSEKMTQKYLDRHIEWTQIDIPKMG